MAANFASPTLGGSFGARGSADAKLWRTTKTAIVAAAKKDLRRSCATVVIGATPRPNIFRANQDGSQNTPRGGHTPIDFMTRSAASLGHHDHDGIDVAAISGFAKTRRA
jgi:hypothetical protein